MHAQVLNRRLLNKCSGVKRQGNDVTLTLLPLPRVRRDPDDFQGQPVARAVAARRNLFSLGDRKWHADGNALNSAAAGGGGQTWTLPRVAMSRPLRVTAATS